MYNENEPSLVGRTIASVALLLLMMAAVIAIFYMLKSSTESFLETIPEAVGDTANKEPEPAEQTKQTEKTEKTEQNSGTVYDVTVPRTDKFSIIDANGNSQVIFEDQVTFNIYNK